MPSFDWQVSADALWRDRYPDWAHGYGLWTNRPSTAIPRVDDIAALRYNTTWGGGYLACPRVFVSHRQSDASLARTVAWIARSHGFQYWLDVEDPTLQGLGAKSATALATAAVIEMALLNCTHVVAVMTNNTHGTMWVPYEYGRVKEPTPHSTQAATWLHPHYAHPVPEYMLLGSVLTSRVALDTWFVHQMLGWNSTYGSCVGLSRDSWTSGAVDPLPE